jgi:hypothetical protein
VTRRSPIPLRPGEVLAFPLVIDLPASSRGQDLTCNPWVMRPRSIGSSGGIVPIHAVEQDNLDRARIAELGRAVSDQAVRLQDVCKSPTLTDHPEPRELEPASARCGG